MNKFSFPFYYIAVLGLALCAAVATPVISFAEEVPPPDTPREHIINKDVSETPVVTLQRWQNAKEDERYAFLVGFVTMMDIEHSWQGEKPLPYKQSLIDCWYQGLKGMTYKELYNRIEAYIAAHPADLGLPLPQVVWFEVVQPKMADKIQKEK